VVDDLLVAEEAVAGGGGSGTVGVASGMHFRLEFLGKVKKGLKVFVVDVVLV